MHGIRNIDQEWGQDGWILAKFSFACFFFFLHDKTVSQGL